MEALLALAIDSQLNPGAGIELREDYFGARVAYVLADDSAGVEWVGTLGYQCTDEIRIQVGGGRVWWDSQRGDNGSKVNYSMHARIEYNDWYIQGTHYSTGKRMLGEQPELYNPAYDAVSIGYLYRF